MIQVKVMVTSHEGVFVKAWEILCEILGLFLEIMVLCNFSLPLPGSPTGPYSPIGACLVHSQPAPRRVECQAWLGARPGRAAPQWPPWGEARNYEGSLRNEGSPRTS